MERNCFVYFVSYISLFSFPFAGPRKYYRSWAPRMTPGNSASHAPGSKLIKTDVLSPKIANLIKN